MKHLKLITLTTIALAISFAAVLAQAPFTHVAKGANISAHMTTIDNSVTNGQSNALLFVTQVYNGKYNNHPFGVWYSGGKWVIYQENKAKMDAGAMYNVLSVKPRANAFMHKSSSSNTSKHMTTIDHPSCNGKPNVVLMVTQNWKGTYNPKSIAVWYNGSKWVIYNQDRTAMPAGTNFNVMALGKGKLPNIAEGRASVFKATASTTKNSYGKHLATLPLMGKSGKIFVTQNYGKSGPYNAHEAAVWNNGKNWTVYNKDKAALPANAQFNILAIGAVRADEAVDPIVPTSKKAGYVRIFNEAGYVSRTTVTYMQNGRLQTESTGNMTLNGAKTIKIPAGVSDIKVKSEVNNVANWGVIFDKRFGANPPNKCFKLYGTVFSPQYNTNCNKQATGGYVKFFNESGYVAKFTITYTFKGERIKTDTGDMALGRRKTVKIPSAATNVKVKGEGSTVFSWTTIFDETYSTPPNKCFKVYATIFSPQWNNDCN